MSPVWFVPFRIGRYENNKEKPANSEPQLLLRMGTGDHKGFEYVSLSIFSLRSVVAALE